MPRDARPQVGGLQLGEDLSPFTDRELLERLVRRQDLELLEVRWQGDVVEEVRDLLIAGVGIAPPAPALPEHDTARAPALSISSEVRASVRAQAEKVTALEQSVSSMATAVQAVSNSITRRPWIFTGLFALGVFLAGFVIAVATALGYAHAPAYPPPAATYAPAPVLPPLPPR